MGDPSTIRAEGWCEGGQLEWGERIVRGTGMLCPGLGSTLQKGSWKMGKISKGSPESEEKMEKQLSEG